MGVYERQQKEKEILEAAIKLFAQKGLYYSKMDEVAKQAKISKGLIYFYYKSKEDLYMAVTKKAFDELKDIFHRIYTKGKDKPGIENISELVENFLIFAQEKKMFHECILHFMGLVDLYNKEQNRKHINPLILESSYFNKLLEIHHDPALIGIKIISKGIKDGSMRPDLQPEATFYTIWTMLIGYERLKGPINYDFKEVKISGENWKNGFMKLLFEMLKGTRQAPKLQAVQGRLF